MMNDRKETESDPKHLQLVEVRYGFLAQLDNDEVVSFNVTASLVSGELDLRVTFKGRDDDLEFLPASVFPVVQEALQVVEAKVRPGDLVEQME
ncbi:MAG: hypothetical protein HY814_07080 [Candidatus Riflebacteria bacterium]|nr:hypothetical protein [Candidatus Riflebacteria bacterium]